MKFLFILLTIVILPNSGSAQRSYFTESGDAIIHYRIFGKGNPILIINGGPGFNSNGFSSLARMIENLGFQAILFDQRGTGLSKIPRVDKSTITMDLMVKDIEAIRKAMNIQEWTILGHSFGGILANYYTSKYPENVKSMVQSSSGGIDLTLLQPSQSRLYSKFSEEELDSLNQWRRKFRSTPNLTARKKYYQLLARAYLYNETFVSTITTRLMEGDLELNRLVWNNLTSIEYDCKKALSRFCKPVLIIQGKQDIVPENLAYIADRAYCNSKIKFLENCGHYGWLEQEEHYFNELKNFLNQVYSKS